jgi:hypothetical protein
MIIDYYRCKTCGCYFKIALMDDDMEVVQCPICCRDGEIDYATDEQIKELDA